MLSKSKVITRLLELLDYKDKELKEAKEKTANVFNIISSDKVPTDQLWVLSKDKVETMVKDLQKGPKDA